MKSLGATKNFIRPDWIFSPSLSVTVATYYFVFKFVARVCGMIIIVLHTQLIYQLS